MNYSTTDMTRLVKQASVLGRLARGVSGAAKGAGRGMLIGGAVGAAAAPLAGAGLAGALGVGGAGLFSGAMLGGSLRGTVGGLRGLLRSPATATAVGRQVPSQVLRTAPYQAGSMLPALGLGAGAGYLLSDKDNKLLGSATGAFAGLLAKPTIVRALAARAGR